MRKIGLKENIQLREHQLKVLSEFISKAENADEIYDIFMTILTDSEREAIAQRLTIILQIKRGLKYYEIEVMLGTAPATITKALDNYFKHEKYNSSFNNVLNNYKEPKFEYKSNRKKFQDNQKIPGVGIRSALREQKKFDERIERNKRKHNS